MILIPEVEKFAPLWVVLGRAPKQNAWQGYIEHSFSMSWSLDRVRLWWSGTAYSFLGTHQIEGQRDAEHQLQFAPEGWEVKAFDLTADDCPIEVDLQQWWTDMQHEETRKFECRNPPFRMLEDF